MLGSIIQYVRSLAARCRSRRTMLGSGVLGLALLTYCGVQTGANLDSGRALPPPTTVPSDDRPGKKVAYDLATGSRVDLEGTTNISDWSCSSSKARALVAVGADDSTLRTLFEELKIGQISKKQLRYACGRSAMAELTLPVTSLRGDSPGMDRDMHSALKAGQFPTIQYHLEKVDDAQVRRDPSTGKPAFFLRVTGVLTVAGVQRMLSTDLTIQGDGGQRCLCRARIPILMTDFQVTPPTALFGLIRARDSLSVVFDLDFVRSNSQVLVP